MILVSMTVEKNQERRDLNHLRKRAEAYLYLHIRKQSTKYKGKEISCRRIYFRIPPVSSFKKV